MPTLPQLHANRINAQFSTGPISLEGKAKVALNSLKHGIFAKDLLARDDAEAVLCYESFKHGILESLQPCDQLQVTLAEKVAVDLWRLRKVLRFEAGAIEQEQSALNDPGLSIDSYKESVIKSKIKDLRDELETFQEVLGTISKKSFRLQNADGRTLAHIYEAAHTTYSQDLEAEDANMLYDCELELDTLMKLLGLKESDFLSQIRQYFHTKINEITHEIESNQRSLDDFYRSREARHATASLPSTENVDKLIKYERSIQKSILQNIAILHKLQGVL